ncbi:MAG TPA: MarR family transcriptional regulator [Candidatus Saccharimonadales bacterium]|nr:MarR family transcriptional regulator [Candidatus Saccharimonadales bacterium]
MNETNISNLGDHIGYWLRCLSNFVSYSFAERLAKENVTVPQWVLLRTLYSHDDITLNQLAQLVGLDKSSVSRMVERLVQRKLVNRDEGNDRRSLGLSLTPNAKKLVPKLAKHADLNDESFFKTLSQKQREEFLGTIKQLLDANGWKQSERGRYGIE